MVIVDTSVWIDYLTGAVNPECDWLETHLNDELGYTDLILCEILQGARDERAFIKLRSEMARFELVRSGGSALAVAAARNYRFLRTQGITVRKTIDCLIATVCIEEGYSLLHRDRDFDGFEQHLGLKVVHPEVGSSSRVN
jgi:predicted nucleic acid-binding protein